MRSAFRPELRPIERAAFIKGFAEKTFNKVIQAGPGAFGNAAWARIACRQGRGLCLRQLPRSRRSSSIAKNARRSCRRCSKSFTNGRFMRDLAARLHQRHWPARRRIGLRLDPPFPLHLSLRRLQFEGSVATTSDSPAICKAWPRPWSTWCRCLHPRRPG
jgi:hypothetical protein